MKQLKFKEELLEDAAFQSLFDNFYFNIDTEIELERKLRNLD